MVLVTNGRAKPCKDTIGGVSAVYFAAYKKVLRSQIVLNGVNLLAFPQTFVYKFEAVGVNFTQTQTDGDGGKSFNQSLTMTFNKASAFDNVFFSNMLKNDYFCVVKDRNGNFVLAGFENGLTCPNLNVTTAGGYKLTFEGQEVMQAPFCENIIDTSFIEVGFTDYILQNNDNYYLQRENENYIFAHGVQ